MLARNGRVLCRERCPCDCGSALLGASQTSAGVHKCSAMGEKLRGMQRLLTAGTNLRPFTFLHLLRAHRDTTRTHHA